MQAAAGRSSTATTLFNNVPPCSAGSADDAHRLERLRQCCQLFVGTSPFHNYTKRRLYRGPQRATPGSASDTDSDVDGAAEASPSDEQAAASEAAQTGAQPEEMPQSASAQQAGAERKRQYRVPFQ